MAMFKAQLQVLEIVDDKKTETLCCLEKGTFADATASIAENNEITYDQLKQALRVRYSGDEYKRALELKLRNLKFKPGTRINSFVHELKSAIRELYNVTDNISVGLIAQNHVLAQLDSTIQKTSQDPAVNGYM